METFKVLKISFEELESLKYNSITDYCRYLVKKDKNNIPDRIEVYRGDMLCLTVPDVKLAATLEPTGSGWRKHRPKTVAKGRGCVKIDAQLP